jgi:hypothetical protein
MSNVIVHTGDCDCDIPTLGQILATMFETDVVEEVIGR